MLSTYGTSTFTSKGDTFTNNVATEGSGGALNVVGVHVIFTPMDGTKTTCTTNKAENGGGGCKSKFLYNSYFNQHN